jgi:hypothetical protein
VSEGWPIPPELRARVVQEWEAILDMRTASPRLLALKLHAARLLVQADAVNVRRERNQTRRDTAETQTQLDGLRALLATQEGRAALGKLTELQPAQLPDGSPPAGPAAGEDVPSCECPRSFPFKD